MGIRDAERDAICYARCSRWARGAGRRELHQHRHVHRFQWVLYGYALEWRSVGMEESCRRRRARVPLSAASPVPRDPPAGPGDEAPRCRLPTAGLLANGGNSGIVLLLPGEADGGLSAIGWHLDVGRCQSRRRPPSRTINQSSRGRNSEHLWAGTWSPVMLVKMGPEGTGGDRVTHYAVLALRTAGPALAGGRAALASAVGAERRSFFAVCSSARARRAVRLACCRTPRAASWASRALS
jgi:hypothetical protein